MTFTRAALLSLCALVSLPSIAAAQEFPKPGPEHAALKAMTGEWDGKVKFYFDPSSPPMESTGTFSAKLDVGGFFLFTDYKGDMAGAPFHGRGTTGYDPFKKKYVGTWVDSMSPAIYNVEGSFDESGKTFSESMSGPGPDGTPMKFRMVTQVADADHMTFTMFMIGADGKDTKLMETAYTRKK